MDITYHQAAMVPQDFVARDFSGQGFTAHDLAVQRPAPAGFTTEDILWSLGIWSVILTFSPVIVFYMLMVA